MTKSQSNWKEFTAIKKQIHQKSLFGVDTIPATENQRLRSHFHPDLNPVRATKILEYL